MKQILKKLKKLNTYVIMKYSLLILLVLTSFIGKSQLQQTNCIGEYPIYFTTSKTPIYQEMDSESAIKRIVPKGEKVYIISSFFGKITGFWEVCYNGDTGYIKKSQLSYESPYSAPEQKKENKEVNSLLGQAEKINDSDKAVKGKTDPGYIEVDNGLFVTFPNKPTYQVNQQVATYSTRTENCVFVVVTQRNIIPQYEKYILTKKTASKAQIEQVEDGFWIMQ